jgi:ArsR family transcriptional regulator
VILRPFLHNDPVGISYLLAAAARPRRRWKTERRGNRLAGDAEVVALIKALGRVGERNIAEIGRVDLVARLHDDLVTVLDVRPEDEFVLGHLPGALNIPLAELERRLGELPKGREVIAYCRGPYCVLSFEAVAALRLRGYRVRRLEDGYPEWKAAGLPIVTTGT